MRGTGMRTLLCLMLAVAIAVCIAPSRIVAKSPAATAFDHEFEAIEGGRLALEQWRGKVLLVVNTASFCGFTGQYSGLQKLWETYESRGLVVIGVPSNDFGEQEPNSECDILGFCKGAFNVTFPLTSKQVVAGDKAHPFYTWARNGLGADSAPRWNFHKYLIGRDGKLVAGFGAQIEPLSPKMTAAIEAALTSS
jgi:glutathione peroxidase